jgi:2-oxoglutarate dehydrogenase E1 component
MYVVNITTPANYFHALRRQLKTNFRKPMIVMSPKTLLRDVRARSKLEELNHSHHFSPVLDEAKLDPTR